MFMAYTQSHTHLSNGLDELVSQSKGKIFSSPRKFFENVFALGENAGTLLFLLGILGRCWLQGCVKMTLIGYRVH